MPYRIDYDEHTRRLLVVQSGFWDVEENRRYVAAMREELGRAIARGTAFDILIDFTASQILFVEAAEQMKPLAAALTTCGARRIAWAAGSALGRMQVRRLVVERACFRMFTSATDAATWLAGSS